MQIVGFVDKSVQQNDKLQQNFIYLRKASKDFPKLMVHPPLATLVFLASASLYIYIYIKLVILVTTFHWNWFM